MKNRCLLTGAGGSIGCHTLDHILHNTDWDVVAVDSFRHKGWMDRIEQQVKSHKDGKKRVNVITHDLVAPFSEFTKKRIGHVDYIISMASLSDVEASIHEPVRFIQNNVMLATNMLEYAREVRPKAFLQVSTDEVYGPTTGKDNGHKEWAPLLPSNPYAASKACQEMIAIAYWRTYGVPLIIVNMMNNFGEMQQGSKFPVMVQKWLENDEEITVHGQKGDIGSRSYIHSRNCSDALLFLLRNTTPYCHIPGETDRPDRYNIVGDRQVDNLELVHIIAKLMGKKPKVRLVDFHDTRPGHDKHYGLDGTKLAELGWKSPLTFEESLKNTIEWQQKNPQWIE